MEMIVRLEDMRDKQLKDHCCLMAMRSPAAFHLVERFTCGCVDARGEQLSTNQGVVPRELYPERLAQTAYVALCG